MGDQVDHSPAEPARPIFEEAAAPAAARRPRVSIALSVDEDVASWYAALPDASREIGDLLRFYMETGALGLAEPTDAHSFRHVMDGPEGGIVEMHYDAGEELHSEDGPALVERNALGDVEAEEWWRHGVRIEPPPRPGQP